MWKLSFMEVKVNLQDIQKARLNDLDCHGIKKGNWGFLWIVLKLKLYWNFGKVCFFFPDVRSASFYHAIRSFAISSL